MQTFNVQQIRFCSMHCLNLGYCLWACGSCLERLVQMHMWGDVHTTRDTCLKRAFGDFCKWAKENKIQSLG